MEKIRAKFQFVPPLPEPISGPSFRLQTEEALNECINQAVEALETSQKALGIAAKNADDIEDTHILAQQAEAYAKDALLQLDSVRETADQANETAIRALQQGSETNDTANEALVRAKDAQATANRAEEGMQRHDLKMAELEGKCDVATSLSEVAKEIADDARDTANQATVEAFNAQGAAGNAQITADTANDTANQALDQAIENFNQLQGVEARAEEAVSLADRAQNSADAAQISADQAQETADRAEGKADAAQEQADLALDTAANADTRAQLAQDNLDRHKEDYDNPHRVTAHQVGTYGSGEIDSRISTVYAAANVSFPDTADVDANTLLEWPNRLLATSGTHFPEGAGFPMFVEVFGDNIVTETEIDGVTLEVTTPGQYVYQRAWEADAGRKWIRSGLVTYEDVTTSIPQPPDADGNPQPDLVQTERVASRADFAPWRLVDTEIKGGEGSSHQYENTLNALKHANATLTIGAVLFEHLSWHAFGLPKTDEELISEKALRQCQEVAGQEQFALEFGDGTKVYLANMTRNQGAAQGGDYIVSGLE